MSLKRANNLNNMKCPVNRMSFKTAINLTHLIYPICLINLINPMNQKTIESLINSNNLCKHRNSKVNQNNLGHVMKLNNLINLITLINAISMIDRIKIIKLNSPVSA